MPELNQTEKARYIREQFPVLNEKVFLNTGTCGPLSNEVAEAITNALRDEVTRGRSDKEQFAKIFLVKKRLRQHFATLLGASEEEVAITHFTTEGMNAVIWGLNWQAGDEVIVSNMEHEGGLAPVYLLRQRKGVTLKFWDVNGSDEQILARLEQKITPRTRLILCSHVLWSSGAVLPVKEICDLAHQKHVYVLVDGAQSVGAIPVNVKELGVDFYAFPGQKWLLGPDGTGGLYVSAERISELSPTYVGYASIKHEYEFDNTGYLIPATGAHRFEIGGINLPMAIGLEKSLTWINEKVGFDFVFQQIQNNHARFRAALEQIPNLSIITPKGRVAGLVNFHFHGVHAKEAVDFLAARRINIRYIPTNLSLRVSTGFYNNEQDLQALCEALTQLNDGKK